MPSARGVGQTCLVDERTDDVMVLELSDPRWADFVTTHPAATLFHHPDWTRLVAGCYGFHAFAFAISDMSGVIRAGLPVVEVRHLRSGPRWVSLPYTDYCPPLASTAEEEEQLVGALRRSSRAAGVRRVEIRAPIADGSAAGPRALRHVSRSLPIPRRSMRASTAPRYSAASDGRSGRD